MTDNSIIIQFQQLIIETCDLLGVEIKPKQSYFDIWQIVCEESSIATLNKLLVKIDTATDITPLEITMKKIILQELQKKEAMQ